MNVSDFTAYWDARFSGCPPVSHLLREMYPDRWFRIHTLPESKRYPETAAEYAEVLRRHHTLLTDLLSREQTIALLATGYSTTPQPTPPENINARYHPFVFVRSVAMHEPDEEETFPCYWHIWLHAHRWQARSLDLLLTDVADNTVANVLLADPQRNVLYHPYDGGADVILGTRAERDHWRTVYRAWLSRHPDGL
jgi:hypothetical protein